MKISGDRNSEHYWRLNFARCPVVTLNGENVAFVNEADDVAGYVVVTEYDDSGMIKTTPDGQAYLTRRIEGAVEIIGARHR